jgi:protein arginine kinase activator
MHGQGVRREETPAGLTCGNCGTTLESLRLGLPTGCSVCYEVFDTSLVTELFASEKIPPHVASGKKSVPLHVGRAPGAMQEVNATSRLLALNEALSDTLKKENYEQAALLRDQIKALTSRKKEEDEKQQK